MSAPVTNPQSIRIKDIARLSGVSVGTVDRVLHNRGRVSDSALKKVLTVLDQIDYKPNLIARTLGSNKVYRIGVLIPDPARDPYWASAQAGVDQAQAEWLRYGVNVIFYSFDPYDKNSFKEVAEAITADAPDGILMAPVFYHESLPYFQRFHANGIPFVLFNTMIEQAGSLSFIGQNLYQSGKLAAELMYLSQDSETGVLAVLHMDEDLDNAVHLAEKERGFREYFSKKEQGAFEIRTVNFHHPTDSTTDPQLIDLHKDPALKGIFVTTSRGLYLTASILERYQNRGITLIGYDMLDENIRYLKKGVIDFIIHQNPKRQAFLGIHHLVGHLILRKEAPRQDLLPLEIISRENIDSYLNSGGH